ncbi:MAG: FHA domain-containing protein [Chloroflexi bacterium]|nr:MAG: FHA domain-containing protein [Chloroflexota bacterium]
MTVHQPAQPGEDLIGQYIGGYKLESLVGTGGMASIYKGYDETLARWVAIKVVPLPSGENAEEVLLARFRQEARAIAALRHRNILTIYGYGEEQSWAYIVMEYVPGGSLKDRIKPDKPFTWEQALTVVIPVADALAFAHERGVIHRDIKPANILMPQEDWPLLADFGLAKMEHSSRPNLTVPGQVLGTMAYAAPEQIQEGGIDARVDIYSLGIVLYELLTGRLPFEGETAFDFLMARLTDPPLPLLEANPNVPPVFVPILDKALAQHPDDRYQTMDEFARVLRETERQLRREAQAGPPARRAETSHVVAGPPKIRLKIVASGLEIVHSHRSELVIGRAYKDNIPDIDLGPYGGSKAGVSRRHARLLFQDGQWFLEDLASTNGTFLNGIKIAPHQLVVFKDGDRIRCGQVELQLKIG